MANRPYLLLLASALLAPARGAFALPDLTPSIYGIEVQTNATVSQNDVTEGCAVRTTGLTLLRFGTKVENVGDSDLVIGNPGCPDCAQNPGASCTNPQFMCDPAIGVAHYKAAAVFELLDPSGHDVVVQTKRGYCFNDDECTNGVTPKYTSCDDQGVSVDCIDDYRPVFGCQYVDVTDVPNFATRAFILRVTVDANYQLPDANRGNNSVDAMIPGCGDGIIQPGEDCDPGPNATSACCDESCHFKPAGTTCRAANGPCDVAETCTGTSEDCPADVQQAGMCGIGDQCIAAGTPDPADACSVCDPSVSPEWWSPNVAADPQGIQCQLNRLSTALGAVTCTQDATRTLTPPLRKLQHLVARQFSASVRGKRSPQAIIRSAKHLSAALVRAAKRRGCNVSDAAPTLDQLMSQLQAFAAAQKR